MKFFIPTTFLILFLIFSNNLYPQQVKETNRDYFLKYFRDNVKCVYVNPAYKELCFCCQNSYSITETNKYYCVPSRDMAFQVMRCEQARDLKLEIIEN